MLDWPRSGEAARPDAVWSDRADTGTGLLEVDLGAIEANWRLLSRLHPTGPVAAVLKADAYGVGAAPIASLLHGAGCQHFFTATLDEARVLRPSVGAATVAVLHGLASGVDGFLAPDPPVPVLNSFAELKRWADLGRAFGPLPAILHIDTGMARLGIPPDEWVAVAADTAWREHVTVTCLMSHLASSEQPGDRLNERQRARFAAACAPFPGVPRSLANSSGIFLGRDFGTDLARAGAGLLGLNPTPGRPNPMRAALRLTARVLQLRDLRIGDSVGYNATWRAARPSRIATIGVGYADGWHRALSNRAVACFDGRAIPLIGRVSMDLSTYDVTDAPGITTADRIELFGPNNPVEVLAEAAGTSGYEILTSLGSRIARTVRG